MPFRAGCAVLCGVVVGCALRLMADFAVQCGGCYVSSGDYAVLCSGVVFVVMWEGLLQVEGDCLLLHGVCLQVMKHHCFVVTTRRHLSSHTFV